MILRLTKFLLILLSFWLVGWLLYKNLVPSGRFEVIYNFQPNPFISALRPPERLKAISKLNKQCLMFHVSCSMFQEIIGDPVYFDLHLPSSFENVELVLKYKNPSNQKFTVSAFTDRKNWQFVTPIPPIFPLFKTEDQGGGDIFEPRILFNIAGLDIVDRTITFILGAPEANQENSITLYEIRAIATKPPTQLWEVPAKILKIFKFRILNS